jgi:hypothetical protein
MPLWAAAQTPRTARSRIHFIYNRRRYTETMVLKPTPTNIKAVGENVLWRTEGAK